MHSSTIELTFSNKRMAQHIAKAILPDNHPLPPGIIIRCVQEDAMFRVHISTSKGIDTLRNTIEDIMSAIDLAVRTLDTVN